MNFWNKSFSPVFMAISLGLLAWLILGHVTALLIICCLFLVMLIAHAVQLTQLQKFLENPSILKQQPRPLGWKRIFDDIKTALPIPGPNKEETHHRLQSARAVGDAISDIMIIVGKEFELIWCNRAAEKAVQINRKNDVGHKIVEIIRHKEFQKYIESGNLNMPFDLDVCNAEGIISTNSIQVIPFGENQNLMLGRDITRWVQLDTSRRDFIANVSHELRTPLTVISGFLETIESNENIKPEMVKHAVSLMSEQTIRMTRLVEDLLTLSRLESSTSVSNEKSINIPEIIKLVSAEAHTISNEQHKILVKIGTDHWLNGNEDEIRSAFSNLVHNAVRYTPEGGTIKLGWDDNAGNLVFSVEDNGIGIDPREINLLTQRFYRADKSRSRSTGGTGLGLAIVKHIVNRHQGTLEINSKPKKGSTFRIKFPLNRSAKNTSMNLSSRNNFL